MKIDKKLDHIRYRLGAIQNAYTATGNPAKIAYGRKAMAILRRTVGTRFASSADAYQLVMAGMPGLNPDKPSAFDRAAWTACGLYALHQKGEHEEHMQADDVRFPDALHGLLIEDPSYASKVRRLSHAVTMRDATAYVRPLIVGLAKHRIACDHALLALFLSNFVGDESRARAVAELVSATQNPC